jgi:hypothetical protein
MIRHFRALVLVLAAALWLCLVIFAQAPAPDITAAQTFTDATAGAAVWNPPTTGGASWRLTFNPTGFTAATLQVESSEDCSGAPCGTWTAVSSVNVINGSNPLVWTASPVVSETVAFRFNHPWLRVNVTSVTGTGTISTLLLGYRGTKPL